MQRRSPRSQCILRLAPLKKAYQNVITSYAKNPPKHQCIVMLASPCTCTWSQHWEYSPQEDSWFRVCYRKTLKLEVPSWSIPPSLMPDPMYPLSENGGRHTQSWHETDTNHIQPVAYTHVYTTLWYTTHALAGMVTTGCIVHLRNISVARQHGIVFLCTQLNSLVHVLKVYIGTAVSVPQVHEVSG